MSNISKIFVFLGWILTVPLLSQQEQGWRGIVPLRSTRAQVEALIGQPLPNGRTYVLKDERVNVVYSQGSCDRNKVEWNVPPNTVLGITIYPQAKMISDLQFDLSKFEKVISQQNPNLFSYINKKLGTGFKARSNGEIIVIEYFPSDQDTNLRCPKFSQSQVSYDSLAYFKFDEYPNLKFADEKERLNNFASRLRQEPDSKGYIIVHPGRSMVSSTARARANRAKRYLVDIRGFDAARIITLEGARREKFGVALYAVPSSVSFQPPYK
jgi:hypothetical protein